VPCEPSSTPQLSVLRDAVGASLGRHVAPRELIVAADLPRTPLGKVARARLRAEVGRAPEGVVWDH